ncbi:MAG: tetratricopeptide repeat protein [Pirellulaceae bacterium]
MRVVFALLALTWIGLWLTPDQQGQRFFQQGEFPEAAHAFEDPLWRGAAWYRAGEFEKGVAQFSRGSSPEAQFNTGNAWLMLGKYDQAIASYDLALSHRPDWKEAQENRDLAAAREEARKQEGGDLGDQQEGADEVVFDANKPPGGQDTEIAGDRAADDLAVQSLWLRRVQTKPADFLKSKFAYQQAVAAEGDNP